ncbi:uncharacterized protein LOC110188850 [Drosophila serrata]|uniref:uncharacterized protein LOC110188850 n=1 Tax=Drosophila serrata TaxID=7274 RepID=UPI000A1D0FE6|nr:uncharacterized protein LOC110188850 [Drosophila serrata]KAH8373971.1 hypothetical protein KR200_005340 [Drosophila serrata]
MGIQSFFSDLKEKVQGKSNQSKGIPLPSPRAENLGEELRLMVNSPRFEAAYNTAAPFLFASLGAWPGYWAFRAMDYHVHRSHIPLEIYIRQTYYQAKAVQLFIIMAGTYTVFKNHKLLTAQNIENSRVNGNKDI